MNFIVGRMTSSSMAMLRLIVPRGCRILAMFKQLGVVCVAACLPAALLADFSYEQSTKITGGAMMSMMRFAGAFSKQAREPIQGTVSVKGNKMVHTSKDRADIIDLDSETMTGIDFSKK